MFVKNKMTVNPISVHPDQTISEVLDLMHANQIHRIPVVEKGKLVGLVTQGVVQENTPSHLTTLSIHEMNYLLSKTKVIDIMLKRVTTINAEALIEEAADIMDKQDIGCLPVVGEDNVLLGILTTSDILKAFVELLGLHQRGTKITVEAEDDHVGVIAQVSTLFAAQNINISHFAVNTGIKEFTLRCDEIDTKKVRKILEDKGFKVTSIK
ncbi:MAG: CBS domain-containing protein [Erysipelotrichaceae bacterium]